MYSYGLVAEYTYRELLKQTVEWLIIQKFGIEKYTKKSLSSHSVISIMQLQSSILLSFIFIILFSAWTRIPTSHVWNCPGSLANNVKRCVRWTPVP